MALQTDEARTRKMPENPVQQFDKMTLGPDILALKTGDSQQALTFDKLVLRLEMLERM